MMYAGDTCLPGAEEVNCMIVNSAMNLSGKRTACGQNSEKLIGLLAPKEQYPYVMRLVGIESLRFKEQRKMTD